MRAEGRGRGKAGAGQGRRQWWRWGGGCDEARDEERGEAGGVRRRQNREDPALDGGDGRMKQGVQIYGREGKVMEKTEEERL